MTLPSSGQKGSIEWVNGVIEWEGLPDAFEQIKPEEINDLNLRAFWDEASGIYEDLLSIIGDIEEYIEANIKED